MATEPICQVWTDERHGCEFESPTSSVKFSYGSDNFADNTASLSHDLTRQTFFIYKTKKL